MSALPERLRQETRAQHEQTEQLLYMDELQQGTLTPTEYIHLLRTHLLFHQALERAIDRHTKFFSSYKPETRRKTPWLLADLAHLSEAIPATMPDLFADWSPVTLLGAAYVGEGSMLGGSVVWKLLQQNPAVESLLKEARFYQGYGSETGKYWREFREFLTKQGAEQPDEVVIAAQRAFDLYRFIFEQVRMTVVGPS